MKKCLFALLLPLFCLLLSFGSFAQKNTTDTTTHETVFTTNVYTHPDTLRVTGKPKKLHGKLLYKTNNDCFVVVVPDRYKTTWLGLISKLINKFIK